MRKIISFMHVSLDGFVAGLNGEIDWIKVDKEIFDYVGKRIRQQDTALYGRETFQMMEKYWPTAGKKSNATKHDIDHSKWYNKAQKIVLSTTIKEHVPMAVGLDPKGYQGTRIISDNLLENINEIKRQEGKDILLFGSPKATHSLMHLNLIDGYWLFVNPIILGKGIPLFVDTKLDCSQDKIKLNLLTTRQFSCGVIELNYLVDRT